MYIKSPLVVLLLSAITTSLALPVTSSSSSSAVSARFASSGPSPDTRDEPKTACIHKAKRSCDNGTGTDADCFNVAIRACDKKRDEPHEPPAPELTCDSQGRCVFEREEIGETTCDSADGCVFKRQEEQVV